MDDQSGRESSGTFTWGVIAGIVVLIGAGGAYLSGAFDPVAEDPAPQAEANPEQPAPTESAQAPVVEEEPATSEEPVASTQPETTAPSEPEVAEDAAPAEAEPVPEDTAEAAPETIPPSLDQIFVEPDGNAVLSGNAEPGSVVRVLLDGETVHSFTVDRSGQFAEFVLIPFSSVARGLTLETDGQDQPVRSDDYLIAALPKPVVEAEPVQDEPPATVQEDDAPPADEGTQIAENTASEEEQAAEAPEEPAADEQIAAVEPEPKIEEPEQQVAILRSGEDGVELVQPATPQEDADQVALDTIGYSDTGDVELTGRVPDGSVVRLYLNNKLVDDLPPADDGKWRSELEDVDPGVYTLRVDEVGSDGTVVSRLETPFKREPLEVLRAAEASNAAAAAAAAPAIRSVTVQEGDTLWAISRERYGDGLLFVRVFEANRSAIRDPDLIYPGQVFTIPE
ncbi:LysM peptidoglycan-binding domain-containing protein [Ruegeria lacuscaerulensis]|uniref:LysM peptidoglycan-binding domain-containing protein n=1 Tax=Ruegeria lacuscaerulensis TaxID=55218 RepID=UPI00147CADEC|nr:LysM peptidoglycan-binding domain-containing protein [Ruegeria lacuscaerulensis]